MASGRRLTCVNTGEYGRRKRYAVFTPRRLNCRAVEPLFFLWLAGVIAFVFAYRAGRRRVAERDGKQTMGDLS